jgi:hypothetical protein
MKKLLKAGLILMGAMAFTLTLASATGGSKEAPQEMKCQAGKCGGKDMKCSGSKGMKKETNTTKPSAEKTAPAKGKCGVGKCS